MNAPLIQITKSGVACSLTAREQTRMRTVFDRTHCLRFPKLLEPALLHPIQTRIEKAGFYEKDYRKVTNLAVRYLNRLNDKVVDNMLNFLLNNEQLFRLIRETTGCLGISGFAGRVYRMSPHTGHYDSWHDDLRDHRLIAMSMNLSTEVYSGGILQIRDTRSGHIVHEAANTGFGDAVLFRLAPFLEHRVTGVEGTASRTAFSGWFRSQPHYQPIVRPLPKKKVSHLSLRKRRFQAKPAVSRNSTCVTQNGLLYHQTNGGLRVFNPKSSVCCGLDLLGARVLELLQEPKTIVELRDVILHEYEVEPDRGGRDLLALLDELETYGLIKMNLEHFHSQEARA